MGLYDTLGGIQLKVGYCEGLETRNVGESVKGLGIPDGVYVGYEGVAIVINQIFVAQFNSLVDKWGGPINLRELLDQSNPVAQAIAEITERQPDEDSESL